MIHYNIGIILIVIYTEIMLTRTILCRTILLFRGNRGDL